MKLITRYVLREFLLFFTLALVATTSILILRQIFLLTKLFVRKDVSLWYLFELLFYALPSVLALTIPMAVLAGMLMVLGQLAFTGEITAMRASGFGVHQLTLPVLATGLAFCLIDFWMMDSVLPWGNQRNLELRLEISRKTPVLILEEGVVRRDMENSERLWLVERIDPKTKELQNVRIWESFRDGYPRLTMAKEGTFDLSTGNGLLTLNDGITYDMRADETDKTIIRFPEQRVTLNVVRPNSDGDMYRPYRNMTTLDLWAEIGSLRAQLTELTSPGAQAGTLTALRTAEMEFHKKFSIPFACLAFSLVSVPFGSLTRRSGFMVGMAVGLPLIIVYYTLLRIGETLSARGVIAASLGPWIPNVPIVLLGILMTIRMLRQ